MSVPQRLVEINEKCQEVLKEGEFMIYINEKEGACVIMNKKHVQDIKEENVTPEQHFPKLVLAVGLLNTLMDQMLIVMRSKNESRVVDVGGRHVH